MHYLSNIPSTLCLERKTFSLLAVFWDGSCVLTTSFPAAFDRPIVFTVELREPDSVFRPSSVDLALTESTKGLNVREERLGTGGGAVFFDFFSETFLALVFSSDVFRLLTFSSDTFLVLAFPSDTLRTRRWSQVERSLNVFSIGDSGVSCCVGLLGTQYGAARARRRARSSVGSST